MIKSKAGGRKTRKKRGGMDPPKKRRKKDPDESAGSSGSSSAASREEVDACFICLEPIQEARKKVTPVFNIKLLWKNQFIIIV